MMWKLLAVFALITIFETFVQAQIKEYIKEDVFAIYRHTALGVKNITHEHVTEDKITYYLFTSKNPEKYIQINSTNLDSLANNKNVQIAFIIHGWSETREKPWYEDLKNAFLTKEKEYYVVQVDWSDPAGQTYVVSSYNTKDVGEYIGDFIINLHKNHSIPLNNFLIVGHSLGGQVSGYIGKHVQKQLGSKLPRIIALDPAGPFFNARPDDERLNKNDAQVVAAIHTDGGTFGYKPSTGTIDFFPNGGGSQPGCARIDLGDLRSLLEPVPCDHHRSWEYFIEAVLNPTAFKATKCSSFTLYQKFMCKGNVNVTMGDLGTTQTGDFYLETNKEKPFARKEPGGGFGLSTLLRQTIGL